jgi:hypothetical protein
MTLPCKELGLLLLVLVASLLKRVVLAVAVLEAGSSGAWEDISFISTCSSQEA